MSGVFSLNKVHRVRSLSIAVMLILTTVSLTSFTATAVGANQNDLNYGGDLPDNSTSISNTSTVNLSGNAPYSSGSLYGELDVGDDEDWFAVQLNANEDLTVQMTYNTTYTSPNGSIYYPDFELWMYNTNMSVMDSSIANNPEVVTSNSSSIAHGGIIYLKILRYSGYGSYSVDLWTHNTSSTGGNGTGGGGSSAQNCTGSGTLVSDILEPNDTTGTATQASILPLSCTGLSIHTTTDEDYFEVDMLAGVSYYANITFIGTSGDIDTRWESSTGAFIDSSGGTGSIESMSYTSTINQSTYLQVFGYSGDTNVYAISITTNLPGGGQSFENVDVTMNNITNATLEYSGLTVGDTYLYNYTTYQSINNGSEYWGTSLNGSFNATGTTMMVNVTLASGMDYESQFCVVSELKDSSGNPYNSGFDCIYIEMIQTEVTSSTTGTILATNLTSNTDYHLWWVVYDLVEFDNNITVSSDVDAAVAHSAVDQANVTFTTNASSSKTWQITWTGPTTLNEHGFVALLSFNNTQVNLSNGDGFVGFHDEEFVPQLPTMLIDTYSTSTTSATNDISVKGNDLVVNDQYKYQILVTDSSGASFSTSTLTSFTATAQNMSMPTYAYSTPNMSGIYCAVVNLYSAANVQLIGDSDCFSLTFDDDNDGVQNEYDLCANTTAGAAVDTNGCELSQKDSDGDGYNDLIDAFPSDSSQYSDLDGDGYGDNPNGNAPDQFPLDNTQWDDQDGDGYGDNSWGNASDAFPYDATQWSDQDGDGYGDNASGNYADEFPTDGTQWYDTDNDGYGDNSSGNNGDAFPSDGTQWSDQDGDGYGDNPNGNSSDRFPTDSTQWNDQDGDGYGDNPTGNNGDAFPVDSSQWSDQDGDGYGDNQAGNNSDAFPSDGTQWLDADGDGYGDNQNGNNADRFTTDSTQWFDADGDGYGDNSNGNNSDLCLNTPPGQVVDSNGCSEQQKDDDLDGVTNNLDACPMTPAGETVDSTGCSGSQEDADNDGVMDMFDICPVTPLGAEVDASGCSETQRDSDDDGINDQLDECPSTTADVPVNGVGCSSAQRDSDGDGITDIDDICSMSPSGTEVDPNGCADAQRDDDSDAVNNDVDQCPDTEVGMITNSVGCADVQLDDDKDMIDNTIDDCPATPSGQQVNTVGCADSQLDQDNDSIKDNKDLCPDSDESHSVDVDGCSEYQLDDDEDGVRNIDDKCPRTPTSSIVFDDGCALSQMDTDQDNVNDAEDDFPLDPNETTDSDGDGISDTYDYYPDDPTKSEQEASDGGAGLVYAIVALLAVCGLAALLIVRKNQQVPVESSPFAEQNYLDSSTESNMAFEGSKQLPEIQDQNQQWEENGVSWSKSPDGSLHYFDADSGQWIEYQHD